MINQNNKKKEHLLCVALNFYKLKNFDTKKVQISNREVLELMLYHQTIVDVNNIKHPLFTPHVCFLYNWQLTQVFENVKNIQSGLCHIEDKDLKHNCRFNKLFFLDPYVARCCKLLYFVAYNHAKLQAQN